MMISPERTDPPDTPLGGMAHFLSVVPLNSSVNTDGVYDGAFACGCDTPSTSAAFTEVGMLCAMTDCARTSVAIVQMLNRIIT